jgi:hypothetical protein
MREKDATTANAVVFHGLGGHATLVMGVLDDTPRGA